MKITLSDNSEVEVREISTGDIFDAMDVSKKLEIVAGNPVYVMDHMLFERNLTLRSIACVDGDKDKANLIWLRSLKPEDYEALVNHNEAMDAATAAEVGARGRDSAASE
ncbi:MAG: hypothetical protein CBB87_08025 [Micavibrio sp. TMED27]|nr:hypothetical protein [Micavibrio sp.]OUT90618.1 MAG: hypothetical protein CBB87_08025 [Micavibrio sp. TMED27]|tara:strand:- start:3032 stop:3358 length:327 start_codon:yes stop_codon:yes gene_type:complete